MRLGLSLLLQKLFANVYLDTLSKGKLHNYSNRSLPGNMLFLRVFHEH